jgi:hypothetical protein
MTVSDKLNKLLVLSATNKLDFNFEKVEDTNSIEITENCVIVKIADYEDNKLLSLLDDKITELENLFK